MRCAKGFSTPPIKVSEMRQLIKSGQFANWIAAIKTTQEQIRAEILAWRQYQKTLELLRYLMEAGDEKSQA